MDLTDEEAKHADNAGPQPGGSAKQHHLVVGGRRVGVSLDLFECLRFECQERGITLAQAYREEQAARQYLARNNLTSDELDRVAIDAARARIPRQ